MNGKAPLAPFCGEGAQEHSEAPIFIAVCDLHVQGINTPHSGRLHCAGEGPRPLQGNLAHPCSIGQFY